MKRTVILALLGLCLPACGCGSGEAVGKDETTARVRRDRLVVWVHARGKVMAESNVTIAPPKWWRLKILKLVAKEGDGVEEGDELLKLDTEDLDDRARDVRRDIRSAEGGLASAQANLQAERDRLRAVVNKAHEDVAKLKAAYEELKSLPLDTDLRNTEIDKETTRKAAEQAKLRYDNMKKLYETGGGVSLQQLEQRELEYRSALTDHKGALLTYQLTEAGSTQATLREAQIAVELVELNLRQAETTRDLTLRQIEESVKKAEGRLNMNKGNLTRFERIIEACTIRAPVAGTVFYQYQRTHEGREKLKEGMEVRPWDRLMELPDTTRMQIQVEVEEQDIGKVEEGQFARITLDAYRQKKLTGKVTKIEPVTQRKGGRARGRKDTEREDLGRKVVQVLVIFNEQDSLIRTGLNGRAEIRTQQQAEGLVIPLKALFSVKGSDVVYVVKGAELVETPVKVGGRSDADVLIIDGVAEGELVSLVRSKRKPETGSMEQ